MKLRIIEEETREPDDIEVVIYCREYNETVRETEKYIQTCDRWLMGTREGKSCRLFPADIYYLEVVDSRTFAYLKESVWQVQGSLESLEKWMQKGGINSFFRVSKSCLINLKQVAHFTSTMGSRIIAAMENGERIMISRHYARLLRAYMKAGRDTDGAGKGCSGKEENHGEI